MYVTADGLAAVLGEENTQIVENFLIPVGISLSDCPHIKVRPPEDPVELKMDCVKGDDVLFEIDWDLEKMEVIDFEEGPYSPLVPHDGGMKRKCTCVGFDMLSYEAELSASYKHKLSNTARKMLFAPSPSDSCADPSSSPEAGFTCCF